MSSDCWPADDMAPKVGEKVRPRGPWHVASIQCLEFSPDGRRLLALDRSEHPLTMPQLWETQTGRLDRRFEAMNARALKTAKLTSDGEHVVASSYFAQVFVWHADGGGLLHQVALDSQLAGKLVDVEVSSDLKWIVHLDAFGIVTVRRMSDGQQTDAASLSPEKSPQPRGGRLSFSPQGKHLLARQRDVPNVSVWGWSADGRLSKAKVLAEPFVSRVNFVTSGEVVGVVNAGERGFWVRAFDPDTGTLRREWRVPVKSEPAPVFEVMGDGDRVAVAVGGDISVWSRGETEADRHLTFDGVVDSQLGMRVSRDGRFLVATETGAIAIWDLTTGQNLHHSIIDHAAGIVVLNENHSAGRLLTGSVADGRICVWDDRSATRLRQWRFPESLDHVTANHDFSLIAGVGVDERRNANLKRPPHWLRIWNAATGKLVYEENVDRRPSQVAFTPDGKRLVAHFSQQARVPERLVIWQTSDWRRLHEHVLEVPLFDANRWYKWTLTADGKAAVGVSDHRHVSVVQLDVGKRERRFTISPLQQLNANGEQEECDFGAMRFDPGGRFLAEQCGPQIRIWNLDKQRESARLDVGQDSQEFVFSHHARWLATTSFLADDHRIRLWDASTGVRKREFRVPHPVVAMTFSDDDSRLILSFWNGTVVSYEINGLE